MRWHRLVFAALFPVAILAACGDSPGPKPSPPPPPPAPAPNPAVDLRIEGPVTIVPGTSAQFRLIATFRDGTTSDVASQATWSTDNGSVLSWSPGGVANAGARGEAHFEVRYQALSRHGGVLVLEDGTYRLGGNVTESGGGLPDARIEVVAGTGRGLTATSRSGGSYALYGVAGEVVLETTLSGFEKARHTIVVNGHTRADLELRPSVTPTDLRGDWRLTLNASAGCAPPVADDATARSYVVSIAQTGTALQLEVKAPSIVTSGVPVSGRVVDRQVTITLPFWDYYYGFRYYAIVERLTPGRLLAIAGTASGQVAAATVTGPLDGEFALYQNESFGGVRAQLSSCTRGDHTFRLERN